MTVDPRLPAFSTPAVSVGDRPSRRVGRQPQDGRVVAIVGAGFSGTMAAIHLRHTLPPDCVIYLFDRTGRFARGPAYAPSATPHLLNVRSGNMSAFADDPQHFERWLESERRLDPGEVVHTEAGLFASRRVYGRYLRALLYAEIAASGGRVRLCADDVTAARPVAQGWVLTCPGGRQVAASSLVLALGNLLPTAPCEESVFHNPWSDRATAGLGPVRPVMIVGTGLTMVDLVLAMRGRGYAGPVVAVSRRGLVPRRHAEAAPPWPSPRFTPAEQGSVAALLHRVRAEVRRAAGQGVGWRAVIDGLRPVTAGLWQGLPDRERARFLRHLRPFWDVHRHRMAPAAARAFDRYVAAGTLEVRRGRVETVTATADGAVVELADRRTGLRETAAVQRLIYATGGSPLGAGTGIVAGLLEGGLVRTDPQGLGLDVTARLQLLDPRGGVVPHAWALGPIVRGVFWECTAVPDIRVQARTIAAEVAGAMVDAGERAPDPSAPSHPAAAPL